MDTLLKARKKSKVSQDAFLKLTGLNQKILSRLENGKNSPQKAVMLRIESTLGKIDWLGTYQAPHDDKRLKKVDALDVQLKLIRIFESLPYLPRNDRNHLLVNLNKWILNYLTDESEREKMTDVHHQLFRDKFQKNNSHKN